MVAHLSYKFTHLAQSLRSGHLTNTIRNAFPSTATPAPTFDFTSNVFGSVSNAANSVGGSATTIGMAAGAFGAGAGAAAGANGGAAGGAGGASSKAGSWSSWGFQGKSLNQGQAAQADSPSQLDNADDDLRAFASPAARRSLMRRTRSPVGLRGRSSFSPSSPPRPSHPDLLSADEAGLSSVRLSGVEMQRMYHTAFSQGKKTDEVREMEMEADEVDLGVPTTDVVKTGRRASVSLSALATPGSSPLVSRTGLGASGRSASIGSHRGLHTSASSASPSPSPSTSLSSSSRPSASSSTTAPPRASLPLHRRNSTSALPSSSAPIDTSIPFVDRSKTPPPYVIERRPPVDGEKKKGARWATGKTDKQIVQVGQHRGELLSPEAQDRYNAILAAEKTGKPALVARAVQQYLAAPSTWSTKIHNTAMAALYRTRQPNDPLDRIVELYNQLFSEQRLHPTTMSYDTIIRAFCQRDDEVRRNIAYIERRMKKKVLAAKARGLNYVPEELKEADGATILSLDEDFDPQFAMKTELQRLDQLRSPDFDYYTPALHIYKALGTLGDRLPVVSVQMLLECAADRGEVDVALALFERLEKSPFQRPFFRAYQSLIRMYGAHEKNPELVKEVFEGYLAARASGVLRESLGVDNNNLQRRPIYRYASVKHAYDTEPDFVVDQDDRRGMVTSGELPDERIWAVTMAALFEAGDAAGAVSLLERLLAAQNSPEDLAPGYPKTLIARTVGLVVRGFVQVGDEASALKWFDQFGNPEHGVKEEDTPYTAFYAGILYAAVDAPMESRAFLNHVYRTILAVASETNPLQVSDFVTVVDCNLETTWSETASVEDKRAALDAIHEFRAKFEQATKAGLLAAHISDYRISSGLLTRIAAAEGHNSLFPRATATFLELANLVRGAMRDTPPDMDEARSQHFRPRTTWAMRLTGAARAVLGVRAAKGAEKAHLRRADEPLAAVADAAKVVSWTNKLRRVVEWNPEPTLELALVQSYLASRQAAVANSTPLVLTGDEWFTVLEAFAHAGAFAKRFPDEVPFEMPDFRLVFDDFLASGVEIPVGQGIYNYELLAQRLKEAGYHVDDVRGFIEAMVRNVAFEVPVDEQAQPAPTTVLEDDAASLASGSAPTATSATAPSVADSAEPQQYPTPPSTPPAYFAELASAPPAAPAPAAAPASFDRQLGTQLEQLAFVGRTSDAGRLALEALNLAVAAAREGRFAHPDSYGRLIEQLGRQHLVQEVRQVYLLAYEAINAMAADPEAQSIAWVMLEDKMIIALAQAGELIDVAHHRDRLVNARCAPSADAYAAMILNMKDTTDDAAVALMLFEESQQYNVRPNVYLFNTLISKLSRARRAKEALEYFELMKLNGLTPTSITYGAIINACCKTGDDVAADHLFSEMVKRPDFKPRVPPYNTMIQFYTSTKPDRARALHYYDELVKARVEPTAHTYKLLLDAYGATGDVPDLEAMQQVFAGLVHNRKVKVSGAHWAALINAYGVVAKNVDRAIAIFDSIAAHPTTKGNPNGPLPDAVVYEALLNGLIANGRAELCDKYLEEMRSKGVRMTAYVANTLIKGYTAQSFYSSARRIFQAMSEPPSGVASAGNHPIDRHPKHHHLAAVQPASADAPTYREPSTYEAMIVCELKAGEVAKAAEVLRLAEARAFPTAVIGRLRKLLTDEGIESLPLQQ